MSGCGHVKGGEKKADLSSYPTSIAARLSAHCTFSLGRPGFLRDFSGGRSGGGRYVTTNGGIVRHWGEEGSAEERWRARERERKKVNKRYKGGEKGKDPVDGRGGVGRVGDERKQEPLYVFPTERVRRGKRNRTGVSKNLRPQKPLGNLRSGSISFLGTLRRPEKSNFT